MVRVPRRRAQPRARRDPVRRADPPGADAAPADGARPHLRRSRAQPVVLARARGGRVRFGADVPHLRAKHVLRRIAVPDRAARVDRARPAEASAGDGDRGAARRRAAARDPVRRLHRAQRGVDTARCCRSAGSSSRGWLFRTRASSFSPARSSPASRSSSSPALCARAAGARARLLRRVAASDRRGASLPLGAAPVRRHRDGGSRLDRPLGGAGRGRRSVDGHVDQFTIWENEIFSRTVGDIYTTDLLSRGLAQTPVSIDRSTGYVRGPDGRRVPVSHVLTDATGEFGGTVVGEDGVKRWFSIASTARCGSWRSSTAFIRRTRGRGSASRTRATSAPGQARSRGAERLGVVR